MVHHLAMQISLKIHPQLNRSGWGEGRGEGDRDIRTARMGLKRGFNETRLACMKNSSVHLIAPRSFRLLLLAMFFAFFDDFLLGFARHLLVMAVLLGVHSPSTGE